jgi:hypothetical protein
MSSDSLGSAFQTATDWVRMDNDDALDPIGRLENVKTKLGDIKQTFAPGPKVDGAAGAVSQAAQLERNIEGGAKSGALDPQTREELFSLLHTGSEQRGGGVTSYEDMVPRIGAIQSRLDNIAAGADTTVNDRLRLNSSILNLRDRPGRAGLLTGG